jgi:hypothetical protein
LFAFTFVYQAEHCGLGNFGSPWHSVAADFQTFSKKEKKETNKTFDNAPGVLP